MSGNSSEESLPWLSVSDLAEYAYCPRAYWYRHHPPREPPDPDSVRSSRSGEAFHQRTLSRARHREDLRPAVGVLLAVVGAFLLILLLFDGFVGW